MKTTKRKIAPSTLLNPVPVVMLSCKGNSDSYEKNNIITLAWVGTVNSDPPMLSVSIRKYRFSHAQIRQTNEFVVNLVTRNLLKACDYCGVRSGRDVDKFAECNLTAEKAENLEFAPAIAESPVSISCKVRQVLELGSHDLFIADIVAVSVSESLFDENGRMGINEAGLIAYSHGEYFTLKGPEGFFGFSIAKPDVLKRRLKVEVPAPNKPVKAGSPRKTARKVPEKTEKPAGKAPSATKKKKPY